MKRLRTRVVGALVVSATIVGGALYTEGANAQDITTSAIVTYRCSGVTNDVAATNIFGTDPQTSAQLLASLAGTLGFTNPPVVQVSVATTRPISVPQGSGPFATSFALGATLPSSLIDGLRGVGLSQLNVTNGSFDVNVTGGTPATLNSSFATYPPIPLVAGVPVVVSQTIAGNVTPTAAAGQVVQYRPGTIKLSLVANVQIVFTLVKTITVNCVEDPSLPAILLGQTSVTSVGGSSTTTGPTSTTSTSTSTSTTSTSTTSTSTSTTSTSTTSTSTTSTTSTSTTSTSTTSTSTTTSTTTIPTPGTDAVSVQVSGAVNYANSGTVGGGGYYIGSDPFGVNRVGGFGTLAGVNGGTASVAVDVNRFLFWNFGTVTITDTGSGNAQITSITLFGPVGPKNGNSTTVNGGALVAPNGQLGFVNVSATFTDNG